MGRAGGAFSCWLAAAASAPGRADTAFQGRQGASAQGASGRRARRAKTRGGSPRGGSTAERVDRAAEESDPAGENGSKKQDPLPPPFIYNNTAWWSRLQYPLPQCPLSSFPERLRLPSSVPFLSFTKCLKHYQKRPSPPCSRSSSLPPRHLSFFAHDHPEFRVRRHPPVNRHFLEVSNTESQAHTSERRRH